MPRLTKIAFAAAILAGSIGLAGTASAEESCHITGAMMTRDAITKSLHSRGYTQVRGLSTHNGCWEAKGLDSKGKRFELELNGATGAIMNRE
ncbi:MAG: PepSY domain-containing protein [Rhodospirillales bacterium]|nr:PepSY domain-containing protein [Rhodospirillales bacterium]